MATIRQAAIENDKAKEGKTCEKTQYLTGFSCPKNTPDVGQPGVILYGDDEVQEQESRNQPIFKKTSPKGKQGC